MFTVDVICGIHSYVLLFLEKDMELNKIQVAHQSFSNWNI